MKTALSGWSHLARMRASAQVFGFRLQTQTAARAALDAAVAGPRGRASGCG